MTPRVDSPVLSLLAARPGSTTHFIGGGFNHGQHHEFDTKHNAPLPNLFVSMLQRMGIDAGKFASSTGSMRGLNLIG